MNHGYDWKFRSLTSMVSLALAELYRTIAAIVRRFDMDLCETSMDDTRIYRELGLGQPKEGEFRLRAKVANVIKE